MVVIGMRLVSNMASLYMSFSVLCWKLPMPWTLPDGHATPGRYSNAPTGVGI